MLDIRNLERRWLKYKIKSYAPHIAFASVGAVLLIALPYIWMDSDKPKSPLKTDRFFSTVSKKAPEIKPIVEESPTVLEPSMDFVQTFQTSVLETKRPLSSTIQTTKPIQQEVPIPKVLNLPDTSSLKTPLKSPPIVSIPPSDKSPSLNRNESKLDIESVERRFKDSSNPSLGLFIARYHYDHGNYSEAYNFALKINSINNKIDESWIIFSKSLVKLGNVEQAKKTLRFYISESNSESARSLLDSIERGTFK
ncbi:MAG: hypothetical protein JZU62_09320 [Sulfuricurvum sp.]|uniref:tetratricopeptide repeat protein n=1 Tax=Sulfuricurvum sp. TaxID=2025608 RepID=UPI0025FE62B8|nr:hypothetical protein [Sulfuricurvum sp.]MBV5321876.1 hypothetical protein [Sulfuricurvum sp.]